MHQKTALRYGALAIIASAVLFAAGGITLLVPGLSEGPVVPILFYLCLIVSLFASTTLYVMQVEPAGRGGFVGFIFATAGAVLYSAPNYVLIAGTSGVQTWHDIWFFAMGQGLILLVGPPLFFVGTILLGVATVRGGVLPRRSGILIAAGAAVWLMAYVLSVVPALLTIATLFLGAGLAWAGPVSFSRLPIASVRFAPNQNPNSHRSFFLSTSCKAGRLWAYLTCAADTADAQEIIQNFGSTKPVRASEQPADFR